VEKFKWASENLNGREKFKRAPKNLNGRKTI